MNITHPYYMTNIGTVPHCVDERFPRTRAKSKRGREGDCPGKRPAGPVISSSCDVLLSPRRFDIENGLPDPAWPGR